MKTLKCPKCGSVRLTLKFIREEKRAGIFDYVLFWFFGIITLGVYFVVYAFAEKKRAELGTEYFECEDCHFKAGAHKFHCYNDFDDVKKEELTDEEKEEIREIGKHPTNMKTWKNDRVKALHKKLEKRKNMQDDE